MSKTLHRQDSDDRNYDQQFDQCEILLFVCFLIHCSFLLILFLWSWVSCRMNCIPTSFLVCFKIQASLILYYKICIFTMDYLCSFLCFCTFFCMLSRFLWRQYRYNDEYYQYLIMFGSEGKYIKFRAIYHQYARNVRMEWSGYFASVSVPKRSIFWKPPKVGR